MMGQAQAYYKQCSKWDGAGSRDDRRGEAAEEGALNRDKGQEEGDYGAACASRSRAVRKLAAWRKPGTKNL